MLRKRLHLRLLAALLFCCGGTVQADTTTPVPINAIGTPVTQDFDTLVSTGTGTLASNTPAGWGFVETGTNANTSYTAGTGSSNSGDTYSFGAAGNTDRAFGGVQSGSVVPTLGARFVNNTGATITSLNISYTGEQWRLGATGRNDRLDFQISTSASSLASGTYNDVDPLDFIAPIGLGSVGALDGNAAANRVAISSVITGLSIANGAEFWIRWNDFNAVGADDGLAIENFSLTAAGAPAVPALSINDVSLSEGNSGTTNFNFTISLSSPAGAGGVSFDIATANNTAAAPGDYTALTLTGQTIPAGASSASFTVQVNGDTTFEANETFFVNITNVTGANVGDAQGTGTIVNDDVDPCAAYTFPYTMAGNTPAELIQAINCANANGASSDTINLNGQTVALTEIHTSAYGSGTGLPEITTAVVIRNGTITRASADLFRFFVHSGGSSLTLDNITLSNGNPEWDGGAIWGIGNSALIINNSRIIGNSGNFGGAIFIPSTGTAVISNTLLSGNRSTSPGGAIRTRGNLTLNNSTIAANFTTAIAEGGGGIANNSGTVVLNNSIVHGNEASSFPATNDIRGTFTANNSLVGVNPSFVNLLDASDTAPTTGGDYRLAAFGLAIDAGSNSLIPGGITTDLDGNPRRYNDTGVADTGVGSAPIVDIGAYERQTNSVLPQADVVITKTNGTTISVPGASTTYTITASNAGPDTPGSATVVDTFPASLSCTWTCVGAGGGVCTAAGAGNINDSVNLPSGGSVTYTASCSISAAATGSLSNTATVSTSLTDPNPGNNSATDTDTLSPQADLSITKSNGASTVTAGGSTTYTIVASNPGPSNTTCTVTDTPPPELGCNWTCAGSGGGNCASSGSGAINQPVNLPAGGSTTFTLVCTISPAATGTLSNTATVAGVATDPDPGNNSATDADPVTVCGTNVVSNLNDSGAGSLRQAILDANACPVADVISFTTTGTIALASALPDITDDLSINGPGADQLTVQGNSTFRLMNVGTAGVDLSLSGLTLAGGSFAAGGNASALEFNSSGGQLVLDAVTLRDHANGSLIYSNSSGGILIQRSTFSDSPATTGLLASQTPTRIVNSTFSGLLSGVFCEQGGTCTVEHSTIVADGFGVRAATGALLNLRSNVLSGSSSVAAFMGSTARSYGNNLVRDATLPAPLPSDLPNTDARLAALGAYGGGTQTRALLPGSPAINAGSVAEIQQVTVAGGAGTFTLTFNGQTTAALTFNATAAQVQAALQALGTVGAGNASVTQAGSVYTVTFGGTLGSANQPQMTAAGTGGATATVATLFDGGIATDQRGVARPQLGGVDIGAFESRGFTLAITGGNNQSTAINTAFANPLVVSVTPNGPGEPVNGGRVVFTAPTSGASASLSPNPVTISAGSASTTATANGTIGGPYTVSAAATGASTVNFSLTNLSPVTTTTITGDDPDPSVVGQPYTVNVQVSSGAQAPLGTVSISDGSGATCGPVNLVAGAATNSTASCSLTSTTAGTKTLTATYTPASGLFQASNGTASHQVNPAATTISVSGPARSRVNQPTAFSFALAVTAPGAGTPTGVVTLTSGSVSCTATLPATSCNLTFPTLGSRTVTASYAGDGHFAASTSSALPTLVFARSDVSITKTDGEATYQPGDLIVYTVQVRNAGPDAAAQVRVQDIVPAGLSAVTWTCDASGGAVCSPSSGSGNLDVTLASMPVGALWNYTFYGTVTGLPAQISNTASLILPADTTIEDPNTGNNSATDISVLENLFANGFEASLVNGPEGSVRLPSAQLAPVLDEVARIVFKLDDKRGEIARVYARLHLGAVEYALATRGGDGSWTLGAWRGYAVDPTLSWNAELTAGSWQLTRVELR